MKEKKSPSQLNLQHIIISMQFAQNPLPICNCTQAFYSNKFPSPMKTAKALWRASLTRTVPRHINENEAQHNTTQYLLTATGRSLELKMIKRDI